MQVRHRGDLSTSPAPAPAPGERSARRQMLTFHRYAHPRQHGKEEGCSLVVLLVLVLVLLVSPASGSRPAHSDR